MEQTSTDGLPRTPSIATLADVAERVDRLLVPDERLAASIVASTDAAITVSTPETAIEAPSVTRLDRLNAVLERIDAPADSVDQAIKRCLHGWRYHGNPRALATSPLEQDVAEIVHDCAFPESTLEEASPLEGDIASVPLEAFDPLQEQIIPPDVKVINGTESVIVDRRVGQTVSELTEAANKLSSSHGADNVAILADDNRMRHLKSTWLALRSSEQRESTGENWRPFLELLSAAAASSTPHIGDVKRVLGSLGLRLDTIDDAQPLDRLTDEAAIWLQAVLTDDAGLTIETLKEQFAFRTDTELQRTQAAIEILGIAEERPSPSIVRELRAYLEVVEASFEAPITDLEYLNPEHAWASDRNVLVLVGGGDGWLRDAPPGVGKRWQRREAHRLAFLLRSGDHRIHLATPADHAGPLMAWCEAKTESRLKREFAESTSPFTFSPEGRPRSGHDRFTKTTLNRLLASPRDTMFADLLDRPERRALTRGSAIHDYADLVVGAPTGVASIGRNRIHAWMMDQLFPLVPEHRRGLVDARLWAAIAVIDAYLEDLTPHPNALEGYNAPNWMDNTIADAFDIALERSVTEQYFRDEELGVSGVVDLIQSPTQLVDFKTGRPRSVADIVERGRVPPTTRRADVQLPLYLGVLRRRQPEQSLAMTFVFCHGGLAASLSGIPELAALSRTIQYEPRTAQESLRCEDTVATLAASVPADHPRARLLSVTPHSVAAGLAELVEDRTGEDLEQQLREVGLEAGLEKSVATAGARAVVEAASTFLDTHLFADDIDRFERFVDTWRARRERFDREGYPFGDPLESRLEFPDLHTDQAPVLGGDS